MLHNLTTYRAHKADVAPRELHSMLILNSFHFQEVIYK